MVVLESRDFHTVHCTSLAFLILNLFEPLLVRELFALPNSAEVMSVLAF